MKHIIVKSFALIAVLLLFPEIYVLSQSADPYMAATAIGGTSVDEVKAVFSPDNDKIILAGTTNSSDLPVSESSCFSTYKGNGDAFVAIFDKNLQNLIAMSYIGGSQADIIYDIAVAEDGSILVAGSTLSGDFPITDQAFDRSYGGGEAGNPYPAGGDVFVAKFSSDLSELLASTFLGGSNQDYCRGIKYYQHKVFIGGFTNSSNFPTSQTAYDRQLDPGADGFDSYAAVLSEDLDELIASSYLGGSGRDFCETICVNSTGEVVLGGWTGSRDFPVDGAYTNYGGHYYDGFVSVLSSDLSQLSASTYIGGASWDFVYDLDVDDSDNIYITGHTASLNFPVSADAFQDEYKGNEGANVGDDAFVCCFSPDCSELIASTYMGGNNWENGTEIICRSDKIYVQMKTNSTNLPGNRLSYCTRFKGGEKYFGDVYIICLNAGLNQMHTSTYIGGSKDEDSQCIAISPEGNVYIGGSTLSEDFPFTSAVAYPGIIGDKDGMVFKIDEHLSGEIRTDHSYKSKPIKNFKVYPNPFTERVMIAFNLEYSSDVDISLCNASGVCIRKYPMGKIGPGAQRVCIDELGRLEKGAYLLRVFLDRENYSGMLLK